MQQQLISSRLTGLSDPIHMFDIPVVDTRMPQQQHVSPIPVPEHHTGPQTGPIHEVPGAEANVGQNADTAPVLWAIRWRWYIPYGPSQPCPADSCNLTMNSSSCCFTQGNFFRNRLLSSCSLSLSWPSSPKALFNSFRYCVAHRVFPVTVKVKGLERQCVFVKLAP